MKIKTVLLVFNVIIVLSFLFVFFMPAIFLGWDVSGAFWKTNWYIALIFVAVLAVLNTYFASSWELFGALEEHDWERVVTVLEERIMRRNRISTANVRLLANGYLLQSRTDDVRLLEDFVSAKRPRVLKRLCLLFGVPHLLSNDGKEIEEYYRAFLDDARGAKRDWIKWHVGFALLLQERIDVGLQVLVEVSSETTEDLVAALALHLALPLVSSNKEQAAKLEAKRGAIRTKYTSESWDQMIARNRDDIHILVLSRLFEDVKETVLG